MGHRSGIARTLSGLEITCEGCKAPVEQVRPDMQHPVPDEIAAQTYGRPPGELVYVVCSPLPDGSTPCLTEAILADQVYEAVRCNTPGCQGDDCRPSQ